MRQLLGGQGGQTGPQTRAELEALSLQRTELRDQMRELGRRRNQIDEQSHVARDPATARELQVRLKEIDSRTARIEGQIAVLDDRIADAVGRGVGVDVGPPGVPTISIPPINIPPFGPPGIDTGFLAGAMAAEALAFVLLGFALFQFGFRRMRAQFRRDVADQTVRLEQLQQAMDVIGVEVERISEGQRYVAKVLADGPQALGAGMAMPVGTRAKDAAAR